MTSRGNAHSIAHGGAKRAKGVILMRPTLVYSTQQPLLVRVIRDERNAASDYKLTRQRAETLLAQGALLFDLAANSYVAAKRGELVR